MSPTVQPEINGGKRRIFLVGAPYVDHLIFISAFPAEDAKLRASKPVQIRIGGNAINAALVLSPLPTTALHILTSLPARNACTEISAVLHAAGIVLDALYHPNIHLPPTSYCLCNEETGSRTIVSENHVPELSAQDILHLLAHYPHSTSFHANQKPDWVHFEGRNEMNVIAAIKYLAEQNNTAIHRVRPYIISVELEKPARVMLNEAALYADVVFYSQEWARANGFTSGADFLTSRVGHVNPNGLLFCTWGKEGAYGYCCASNTLVHATPPKLEQVTDTVGAGDAFIAGIINALNSFAHYPKMCPSASDYKINGEENIWTGLDQDGLTRVVSYGCQVAAEKVRIGNADKVFDTVTMNPWQLPQ